MQKLLNAFLGLTLCTIITAQQVPQVSHFMYDNLRTNPGSAGSMDMVCVSAIVRTQMQGMPGAPITYDINSDVPFNLFGTKHGVGITILNETIGLQTDTKFNLTYAFRFNVGDGTLGIGAYAGFIESNLQADKFFGSDGQPITNDENIPGGDATKMALNVGAGLFYRSDDIYFGISSLQLNKPHVEFSSGNANNSSSNYNLDRHYYVTSGYNMQLSNPAWELRPAVLLKSDGITTDMDINLTGVYNKRLMAGVSYRTAGAIVAMAGIELFDGLKLGYSYDVQTTSLITQTQGSHELMLNYCFKIGVEKAPQKYKSIRFL